MMRSCLVADGKSRLEARRSAYKDENKTKGHDFSGRYARNLEVTDANYLRFRQHQNGVR